MADLTDLVPVSREEFATELVPCLALVGGAGMNVDARREWLNAAFKALHGIPIRLLQRGAQAAMAKADHPSKIVPAILAEVQGDWNWRRNYVKPSNIGDMPTTPRVPESERKEVAALFDQLLKRLEGGRDSDASLAEDPQGLSGEAVAARAEGIAPEQST